jgi:hypothetical protein
LQTCCLPNIISITEWRMAQVRHIQQTWWKRKMHEVFISKPRENMPWQS